MKCKLLKEAIGYWLMVNGYWLHVKIKLVNRVKIIQNPLSQLTNSASLTNLPIQPIYRLTLHPKMDICNLPVG